MIEFKAACGHTVRAKDEDAGGVVRCSYCGRQVDVPDSRDDNLDFLFRDDQAIEGDDGAGRRRRSLFFPTPLRVRGRFDPYAVIVWMCYVAVLFIVVIVVARKGVPLGQKAVKVVWERVWPNEKVDDGDDQLQQVADVFREEGRLGLTTLVTPPGLYVASTPPGATVYIVRKSNAPHTGRIQSVAEHTMLTNDQWLNVPDGEYVVEVVLPWHDQSLVDKSLPNHERYCAFRRAVEDASEEQCVRLLEDYFVPDEAWPVFIDKTEDQIYIVRQYRDVVVDDRWSKGVRAMFLPKIAEQGRKSFSLATLVRYYVPEEEVYVFDRNHAYGELEYYKVPVSDRGTILQALTRVGVIPYVTPDGRTRLFKIGIKDGIFAAKVIRETTE